MPPNDDARSPQLERGTTDRTDFDPITFSVILNRLQSIAEEMTLTLEYSAWTAILSLARDFSCAIFDVQLRQIAMLNAVPIHTTSMDLILQAMIDAFDGQFDDGDVIMCNSPYHGNTHVGDLVTASPVFVDGEHLFWAVTRGHQLDTGAFVPSSVTSLAENIWQEGVQVPPVKIVERGRHRKDVVAFYLANVRYADALYGDLLAQIGSIARGEQRLRELCQEYGAPEVLGYIDAIIDYADERMTAAMAAVPDGVYTGEGWVDSDGFGTLDLRVAATVTIDGDMAHVDFAGSDPQGRGGANGSFATSRAAAAIPFLCYIDPDIPHNAGCIRHVTSVAPAGTVCNAEYPASTSIATAVPSDMMQDAIHKAMAAAIPDLVPAGGPRCGVEPVISGVDSRDGTQWGFLACACGGGGGAAKGTDGWPLIVTLSALGGLKVGSVEQTELLYPVRVETMEVERDSMGLGEWIGGPGVRYSLRALHGPLEAITFGDGVRNPPHGVLGGTHGIGGGQYTECSRTGKRTMSETSGVLRAEEGDRWVGVQSGGGGYGNPLSRPVERVRQDVRDGFISHRTAAATFGVVVTDDFDPAVDVDSSEEARARLAQVSRPLLEPARPGAGRWLAENARDEDQLKTNPTL